ncbi:MAG: hypothetical protein GC160_24895 [Acidobacteria bacterium]|nr:hypothetical protein [Acidobacteriota bacterium]
MKLFGISNHGLAAIGLLVMTLWGVIFLEQSLNRQAQRDYEELRKAWPAVSHPDHEKPAPVLADEYPLRFS